MTGPASEPCVETLVELLRSRALREPERRVYSYLIDGEREGATLTYADLDRQARVIASVLQRHDVKGKRVVLLFPTGPEFAGAFWGCLYSGAIAVPTSAPDLDRPHRTLSRLQAIINDAQPILGLTTSPILDLLNASAAKTPELSGMPWLATDALASEPMDQWRDPGVVSDTPAYLQYTSGSTTTPKGVVVTHGNVLRNSVYIRHTWGYTPESISVMWVPHFHDDGLVHGIIQPVFAGFQGVFLSPSAFIHQPIRWLQAISRYRATHSGGPNFAYALCASKIPPERCAQLDLRSWRVAYNAAEPIRKETLEHFAKAFQPCGFHWNSFYPAYGLAEATLLVSTKQATGGPLFCNADRIAGETQQRVQTLVGCGRAAGEMKIVIVHPETFTRCAPNEVGEIWLSDPSVTLGYWNRPEETERTFGAHLADTGEGPFLRTGDLGFLKDQELYVTGRLKDLIIIRGQNYYPQDIEWTVQESHPSVRPGCCAAFSVDVAGEERLVVLAEVRRPAAPLPTSPDYEPVLDGIRQAVSEQHGLHAYAVSLLEQGSILKTSSGKIQRRACRAGFLAGTLKVVRAVSDEALFRKASEASNDWMALLQGLQKDTLHRQYPELVSSYVRNQVAKISGLPRSNLKNLQRGFFEMGIDSLMAVELKNRIQSDLGRPLPETLLIDYPNMEVLARFLLRQLAPGDPDEQTRLDLMKEDDLQSRFIADVEQLTEKEMETLITKELDHLNRSELE